MEYIIKGNEKIVTETLKDGIIKFTANLFPNYLIYESELSLKELQEKYPSLSIRESRTGEFI